MRHRQTRPTETDEYVMHRLHGEEQSLEALKRIFQYFRGQGISVDSPVILSHEQKKYKMLSTEKTLIHVNRDTPYLPKPDLWKSDQALALRDTDGTTSIVADIYAAGRNIDIILNKKQPSFPVLDAIISDVKSLNPHHREFKDKRVFTLKKMSQTAAFLEGLSAQYAQAGKSHLNITRRWEADSRFVWDIALPDATGKPQHLVQLDVNEGRTQLNFDKTHPEYVNVLELLGKARKSTATSKDAEALVRTPEHYGSVTTEPMDDAPQPNTNEAKRIQIHKRVAAKELGELRPDTAQRTEELHKRWEASANEALEKAGYFERKHRERAAARKEKEQQGAVTDLWD